MKKVLNKLFFVTMGTIAAPMAFAAGGGGVGDRLAAWMDELGVVGDFLYVAAFLVGLFMGVNGLMKIKAWADNPQQNQITKPLIYAIVGAFLMGFTAYSQMVSTSVVGEEADNQIDNLNKF